MLQPKKSIHSELERFDAASQVVEESRSWIELRHIVSLSGVSLKQQQKQCQQQQSKTGRSIDLT